MTEAKFKIEIEVTVTEEQMSDIMVTALEGGINYWCRKARIVGLPDVFVVDDLLASDAISKGRTLELYDANSKDTWDLTQEKLLNGIKMYMVENGIATMEDLIDNHDADTADTIVQYAIFNELMFS